MKMTDELETVMGGVRMGVNVDIKRTDGELEFFLTNFARNIRTKQQSSLCSRPQY